MAPRVDPVRSDDALPARADVVIIGGGIIGTSTALFLAQKGIRAVLCEKGHIAGEQSSRNWGWCRKMGRDPRELPLIIESLRLWQGMNELVEAETGFRQAGIMYLAENEAELGQLEAWLEHARQYQLDTRLIGRAEAAELMPGLTGSWTGALYTASDGKAEPQRAAPAIAEAARRLGAAIVTQCAVRGIETAGGRVSAAVTEKGRIACDTVVLAGGAWCRLFCGNLGIELPQLKVLATVMRTQPLEGGPEISASGGLFGFRKRMDGGYTVATLGVRTIDLVPDNFRLFFDYLPAVRLHWKKLRFRVGRRWVEEWRTPRRWGLDEASPFEAVRVLDPGTRPVRRRPRARRHRRGLPGIPQRGRRGELGRHDRRHARCHPGDLAGREPARLLYRDRLFRSRLRHRARGRQAGRRHGRRRPDPGRPDAVPPVAVHRRLEPAAAPAGELKFS